MKITNRDAWHYFSPKSQMKECWKWLQNTRPPGNFDRKWLRCFTATRETWPGHGFNAASEWNWKKKKKLNWALRLIQPKMGTMKSILGKWRQPWVTLIQPPTECQLVDSNQRCQHHIKTLWKGSFTTLVLIHIVCHPGGPGFRAGWLHNSGIEHYFSVVLGNSSSNVMTFLSLQDLIQLNIVM